MMKGKTNKLTHQLYDKVFLNFQALGFPGNPTQKKFKVKENSFVNMGNKFKVNTKNF